MSGESDENKEAPDNHAESETTNQSVDPGPQQPPAIIPPDPPLPPFGGSAAYQEPHERREKTKLVLEVIGGVLLLVYTVFTALQWSQIRWTNRLTDQALKGSGDALSQTLTKMQGQIDAAGRQADRTKDLSDRMKDQADQTQIIAKQAKVSANAAKSAAETAKEALHVSQRAYLVLGIPMIHTTIPRMEIPIDNIGHIASGPVTIITQGAVLTGISTDGGNTMSNGWGEITTVIAPGSGKDNFTIPLSTLDANRVNNGTQFIFAAGTLSYNDGFPNTPIQVVKFCWRSMAVVSTTPGVGTPTPSGQMQMDKCDPDAIIPMMEKWDEHYDPKYKWPTLPPS